MLSFRWFVTALLLATAPCVAQPYSIGFADIHYPDTIVDPAQLAQVELRTDHIRDDGSFGLAHIPSEGPPGLVLIKAIGKRWLVYHLPVEGDFTRSHSLVRSTEDGRYFLMHLSDNHTATGSASGLRELWIVDVRKARYAILTISTFHYEWTPEEDMEMVIDHKWTSMEDMGSVIVDKWTSDSNVLVQGNELIMLTSCVENGEYVECADAGGVYVIGENALTRTKVFDPVHYRMRPLRAVGGIGPYMTLNDVEDARGYPRFVEVKLRQYGFTSYSSEDTGYEVWEDDSLLFYLRMGEGAQADLIMDVAVLAPRYSVDGMKVGMRCVEVLRKYPELELHIEPYTGWEYADIAPGTRIFFRTTDTNRVGCYETVEGQVEPRLRKVARTDAPVDMITFTTP